MTHHPAIRLALIAHVAVLAAVAQNSISAPSSVTIGSKVEVSITGSTGSKDFVTIVKKDTAEGKYSHYQYPRGKPTVIIEAPDAPGDYEVRLLSGEGRYPTLARKPIKVEGVSASLDAPDQVEAGAEYEVKWTGPANERDFISIAEPGSVERSYITYRYTNRDNPAKMRAPDKAGTYELRYHTGRTYTVLATRAIVIGAANASITVPAQVQAGTEFDATWTGPDNQRDFITIVEAGAQERSYKFYRYTNKGNPAKMRAPDKPGDYEVRYASGQSYATLGKAGIKVLPVGASLEGPTEAVAGTLIKVGWKGPDNRGDFITIVEKGAPEQSYETYQYTKRGNPVTVKTPNKAGDYELRYATGQSYATLARAAVRITPGETPGTIRVVGAATSGAVDVPREGAVEIILDASGSMLQKMGSARRIDVAKQTLTKLTSETIPAGTPFAMRVFGKEIDSCQTDLEIPLGPLDAAGVAAKIGSIQAKNKAKTPIGASLAKVLEDLGPVRGERVVVLITDGEETCGGDPAAAVEALKSAGVDVRVNIVGFAIDDQELRAAFRYWADLGGGGYFNADDATALSASVSQALRQPFEVVNAQGQVVAEGLVGGDPVEVMPGSYTVRTKSKPLRSQNAEVKPRAEATVELN